jgi:hypothetical protein
MIAGAHFLLYSKNPQADQAFVRDILGFRAVDAGAGRLIFALPPAEMALHPSEADFVQRHAERDLNGLVVYLMCDDLPSALEALMARGVDCTPIDRAERGTKTTIKLPGGRVVMTRHAGLPSQRPTGPMMGNPFGEGARDMDASRAPGGGELGLYQPAHPTAFKPD